MIISWESVAPLPVSVKMLPSFVEMNDDQFFDFCQVNRELRIQCTAEGDILITAPAGSVSSQGQIEIAVQLILSTQAGMSFRFNRMILPWGSILPNWARLGPRACFPPVLEQQVAGSPALFDGTKRGMY